MDLEHGQTFGRYEIERVLGEGGMGRVYLAVDKKLLRRVALKVLRASQGGDDLDPADLVLREARAAAALAHENAVTIFDVGDVDGVPYIAMEHVAGTPLRAFVGDETVPMAERVGWLAAIARALGAAHERGLVHRDVKPENVLVREDGVIKVLDFGIAHHRRLGSLGAIATTSSAFASDADTKVSGTPAYMAPEQLRGEALDGRADQFAWGLVAYELLTGRPPTKAATLAGIIADRLERMPPPPRTLQPDIPEHVDRAIVRALMKAPADRFATMGELLSALEVAGAARSAPRPVSSQATQSLESAPTVAASEVTIPPAREPPRRRRLLVAAFVGVVAFVAALALARRGPPPASAPVAVTDLPVPSSAKLDAVAAYRAGLQAARDGAGSEARVHFARAAELDPTMASAHLWLASLTAFQNRAQARAALDRARQQRASLSPRDARLLASLEPLLDRDPADLAAAEGLALEATQAFPRDAHLRLQLAIVRAARGERGALADADAALALDPKFVAAHLVRALALESLGQEREALAAYQRCVAGNPASASCFAGELKLLSRKGECDQVGDEARRWTNAHPSDPEAFRQRAIFLSFRDAEHDNVAELLATSRSLLPDAARKRRAATDDLALALLAGELPKAKAVAEALAAGATDVAEHGEAAVALVEIDDELDHPAEAARVAFDFLKRRELWAGAARMEQDPTPLLVARAERAGLVPAAEADELRRGWLERWATRGRSGERWLVGHAEGVETEADARRALEALPRFAPLPALADLRLAAALGHVELLGGRADEGIAALESAVHDCAVLRAPVVRARALLWLGEAYATKHDKAKACDAFRRVGAMWSLPPSTADAATPVTLKRARAASSREGC